MKTMIAVFACVAVVEDDERDGTGQVLPSRNPLDDLIERMRREMHQGYDNVNWGDADGPKVA